MKTQVKIWGNSQGVRLTKEILNQAGVALNEILNVVVSDGTITLSKNFKHKTLEERVSEYGGKLFLDGEYNWGDDYGREAM